MSEGRRRRWIPTRHALEALGAGVLMALSLPPWGWWPLAVAGIVLLDRAIAGAPFWARFRRGWLTGAGLLGPSTIWMAAFTPPGYVIQVAAYSAILGLLIGCCPADRWRWLALPGAWVLFEAVKGRWPFGGVPLSELAMGQVAGPLAGAARTGGILLIALLTVTTGVALAAALRRAWVPAGTALGVVVLVVAGSALAPRGSDTGESIDVAFVQGGGEQGTTDEETDDRQVFLAHLLATEQVPEGTDLIVWPENVVNVNAPLESVREHEEMADMAREKRATLVAGIVESAGPDHFRNYSIVYGPDGEAVGRYDKVRRVPFGEFVPLRGLLEAVAGDSLPGKDAIPGTASNTVDTPAGRLGIVISWEVFFGDRAADAVNGRGRPAELLLNPTNGSSYSGTLVQSQQVASSRLRALETGRWVVQAAPTGFSAFVTDEGDVLDRTGVSEQQVRTREVPLREGRTLYLRWGVWPTLLLALASVVAANLASRAGAGRDDGAEDGGDGGTEDETGSEEETPAGNEPGAQEPAGAPPPHPRE